MNKRNTYINILTAAILLFAILNFCGCASKQADVSQNTQTQSASANNMPSDGSSGSVKISVAWPKPNGAKLIPTNTTMISVEIYGTGMTTARQVVIQRSQASATMSNLPAGSKTAEIKALSENGTVLAHSINTIIINSGQTTNLAATLGVTITSSGFIPQNITIAAGDTLYFANVDTVARRIVSDGNFDYTIAAGASQAHTFASTGVYSYYDYDNHGLTGTITASASHYITSLNPTSGTLGTSVTINGSGFGALQGTSTVTFDGTTASITSWNNTQIVCTAPIFSYSADVIVTVASQASNTIIFTMSAPTITSTSVGHAAIGAAVTINGTYFGPTQGTSKVKFNGVEAAITSWGNTQIVCTVPEATTGNITVTVGSTTSAGYAFTVDSAWSAIGTFNPPNEPEATYTIWKVMFVSNTTGYCIANDGFNNRVCKTTDGGVNWSTVYSSNFGANYALYAFDANIAWAGGWWVGGNSFIRTTDAGVTWTNNNAAGQAVFSIYAINSSTGWLGYNNGLIYKFTDFGATATLQYNNTDGKSTQFWGVHFEDMNTGWTVGTGGAIKKTINGGTAWTDQTSGVATTLADVFFVSTSVGWTVGDSGVIRYTSNGGTDWSSQTSGTAQNLHSVCFISTSEGWVCGNAGVILHTTNGGTDWSLVASGTAENLYSINFTDATHGWCVGTNRKLLYYH